MQDSTEKETVKSKAIQGILWGGMSNGAQQILALLFGIYLARNLTEADYGIVGILTVFSLIASSIQESGFINALANKQDVTHKDYNAVFWFNILLSGSLYTLLYFAAPYIAQYFNMPELTRLARVLFLSFLFGSFGIVHSAYLFRNLKVRERALATLMSVLLSGIIAIVMVHFHYSYWSLVGQSITYSVSFAAICFYFSDFRPSIKIDFSPIKGMWKFSIKILASNITNHINNNILTLYLGRFFSKDIVGNYSQAFKWSNMPQGIIANMSHGFAQPLLAKFENDAEKQNLIFLKLFRFICFMSFPALALLCIISKEFIVITITDKWINAVPLLKILCINAAFLPLINYYSNYFLSRGASQIYMRYNIVYGLIQLSILFMLRNQEMLYVIWAITGFTCIWTFVWQVSVSKYSNIAYGLLSKIILEHAMVALLAGAIAYFITAALTDNLYFSLLIKVVIFGTLYLTSQFLLQSIILKEITAFLKNKICK